MLKAYVVINKSDSLIALEFADGSHFEIYPSNTIYWTGYPEDQGSLMELVENGLIDLWMAESIVDAPSCSPKFCWQSEGF